MQPETPIDPNPPFGGSSLARVLGSLPFSAAGLFMLLMGLVGIASIPFVDLPINIRIGAALGAIYFLLAGAFVSAVAFAVLAQISLATWRLRFGAAAVLLASPLAVLGELFPWPLVLPGVLAAAFVLWPARWNRPAPDLAA